MLDKMAALEARVRGLVEVIQELRRANATLQQELRAARERMIKQDEENRRWEDERGDIRSRIEKVLAELEVLECLDESKEVALD